MCAEGRRSATFSLALNATYSRKLRSLVSFIHPRLFHITTANEALAKQTLQEVSKDDLVLVSGAIRLFRRGGALFEIVAREILVLETMGETLGAAETHEIGAWQ